MPGDYLNSIKTSHLLTSFHDCDVTSIFENDNGSTHFTATENVNKCELLEL